MESVVGSTVEKIVGYLCRNDAANMSLLKGDVDMLCSRANDIEGEVKREEMSSGKKRKREVEHWLEEVKALKPACDELEARVSSNASRLSLVGDPVGKMQNKVKELGEQCNHFTALVIDDLENTGQACPPTKMFGKKINQSFERILPCLEDDGISSIGIYGMGGVGKTTLARHLESHLQSHNYCVYWVTVSQEFSIAGLQDKFAHLMGLNLSSMDEVERRAMILREAFSKRNKLVLILDDVWDEIGLEKLGITPGASKCRVILTTRSKVVCDRMRLEKKFDVITLDEDEAWDLFKYTLGHETVLEEEAIVIAKSITSRCDGLPLAIIAMAGAMRGVEDTREWRIALQQLELYTIGHPEMEEKVFPILELSFFRLDEVERNCFFYCSLYPEDFLIHREELVQLFALAELVPRCKSLELECDYGHKILNKLIKVHLLEGARSDVIECVKMHDVIRDMALRITSGYYMCKTAQHVPRFLVKSKNEVKEEDAWRHDFNFNAVSWSCPRDDYFGVTEIAAACPALSTLIIFRCSKKIPDSVIQLMQGLKVLNVNGYFPSKLRGLPNCISDLENLTGLLLGRWRTRGTIKSVPPLGKLRHLRVLDLLGREIDDLPQGLEILVNLERLCLHLSRRYSKRHGSEFPKETVSKMEHLQHLELLGQVRISDPCVLKGLHAFRGHLTFNVFLTTSWWPKKYHAVVWEDQKLMDDGYYIEDRSRHINEQRLEFKGCKIQNESDVLLRLEVIDIRTLILRNCVGVSDVIFFNRLRGLSCFEIRQFEEVEFLLNSPLLFPFLPLDHAPLQNLKQLNLRELPTFLGLVNWTLSESVHAATFSTLCYLFIEKCDGLKKLFSQRILNQNLQNLGYLHVTYCSQLEELVVNDDGGELIMSGQASSGALTPSISHLKLPKLVILNLQHLPRLGNICKPGIICDSIERIKIHECPKITRLPFFHSNNPTNGQLSCLKTLKEITGSITWWNALEWDDCNAKASLQQLFRESDEEPSAEAFWWSPPHSCCYEMLMLLHSSMASPAFDCHVWLPHVKFFAI